MLKTRIFLAGDSTVAENGPATCPQAGWGQKLSCFFNDSIKIINCAVNGASSKSFIDEGRLKRIAAHIGTGDWLFIQFGHNDSKTDLHRTNPATSYKTYLEQFINVARSSGAQPALITSVHRLRYDRNGKIENTHADYHQAMRELAADQGVPLLDLGAESKALFEKLWPVEAQKLFMHLSPGEFPNYPDGKRDDTHFRQEGALEIARLVVREIRTKLPGLARSLSNMAD